MLLFRTTLIFFLSLFILPVTAQKTGPVKIGLLIQESSSPAAKYGAELAINMANANGGFNGRPFQLLTKGMEGSWGTGSKQAVALIFEDEVWALLGSHDGRNAHLVEQASAKSIVPFLSAWPSDPTLAQAFIPWVFNCVPSDDQQAEALMNEIFHIRKISRVAVITDKAYDSNQSLKSFLKITDRTDKLKPVQFTFNSAELNLLTNRIRQGEFKAIVIFCQPFAALQIIRMLHQKNMDQPVFGSLFILNENELSQQEIREFDQVLFMPSASFSDSKGPLFRNEYRKTYGIMPGMVAAYAFDGMNVLIEAIRTSGVPEREKIQEALFQIRYEGVTGPVSFDRFGNRQGIPAISMVQSR